MSTYFETVGPEGYGTYQVEWTPEPVFTRVIKPADAYLVPGFVDLHIHGGWGIDFMSATTDEMLSWADGLSREGYEAFLPTTVAASPEAVLAAVERLPDDPRFLGFHLEGPFLSPTYPGAQPQSAIRNPEPLMPEWDAVLDHPKLKVVTMAPELPHALSLISRLRQRGVSVSMGHSNATYEETRRGFEFGAGQVTHTFNAMRPFHHREAGMTGYALLNPSLNCELIYDRLHVSREAASLLFRCRPGAVLAVSDGTAAVGLPAGHRLDMWGEECEVGLGDVRLVGSNALAGSAITMRDAFANLVADFGFETAFDCCCAHPRRVCGLTAPTVHVEMDSSFRVQGIWKNGTRIHEGDGQH